MRLVRWGTAFAGIILYSTMLLPEEKPWIEVRSPHFRLLTNGSERSGRHMVREFELMRAVFEAQFPGFKLDAPAPLLILAPKDEYTAKQLLPELWPASGPRVGGLYLHGWEREYAIVRLDFVMSDLVNPDLYQTVYHEYIHSLLHINFRWLPSWLDEGLAEFYGYTRFEKDKMYIGAPPRISGKISFLDSRTSIPLEQFIQSRMFSRDNEKTKLSYMQAWALTHFLTFGPGMENGKTLSRFFNALQHGVEQKKAFQEAFGKFDTVQKQYDDYIQKFAFTTGVLAVPARLQESDFSTRSMSLGETQAEMAAWHIRGHRWELVRALTEAALRAEPKLSLAHEDMGFFQFNEGRDEEALKEFSAAFDLDNKNYIALFAKTMSSPLSRSSTSADREVMSKQLNRVLELKPDFAPAYVELAKLALAGGQMDQALALSKKAEQLEPFRAGYHVLSGEIMLRMGRAAGAAAEAAFVAQGWGGSDRDEALELWNRIPAADRPADLSVPPEAPVKWQTVEGVVKSVACNGKSFAITIETNGQAQTFKSEYHPVGFSDTLWVGSDHFSPCFHVQGLRVRVNYNASQDSSYAGNLIHAGFKDDLGPASKSVTATADTH